MNSILKGLGGLLLSLSLVIPAHAGSTLLNVSYDPTRELYKDYNAAFHRKDRR